jgi:hypothetical protein
LLELGARRRVCVEPERQDQQAPLAFRAGLCEPLTDLRAHGGIGDSAERRRRGGRNAEVRKCVEQEALRRRIAARELADLEHGRGTDVRAPGRARERCQRGGRIERTRGGRYGRECRRLVGVVEDQVEEPGIGKPVGEDQRERAYPQPLRERVRDRGSLGGELRHRRIAESLGDAGEDRIPVVVDGMQGVAVDSLRKTCRELGLRGRARGNALPVAQYEAGGRTGII